MMVPAAHASYLLRGQKLPGGAAELVEMMVQWNQSFLKTAGVNGTIHSSGGAGPGELVSKNGESGSIVRRNAQPVSRKTLETVERSRESQRTCPVPRTTYLLVGAQLRKAHGAPGVELLGGDAHLAAQSELAPVGEAGGGVPIDRGGVHLGQEPLCGLLVGGDDGVRVAGGVGGDVGDGRTRCQSPRDRRGCRR